MGRALPDPPARGSGSPTADDPRGLGPFWNALGDDESRSVYLRILAYRALGPAHVRLQLDPADYRRAVIGLTSRALVSAAPFLFEGMPLEWQLHHYDLSPIGVPMQVLGSPLPLASTFLFSQYAYRDASVPGPARAGDIALDVGGCWGETALWLAHAVGAEGHVHTFEPTPGNLKLLQSNLDLNPSLSSRITLWRDPLAAIAGEIVHMPDVIAAGATMRTESEAQAMAQRTVPMMTQTIDGFMALGDAPRVDFIKVDVEGADLGVLQGAAETIVRHRPTLALACYHRPDDLVSIPDFIASLGIEYRWYLQCSTMTDIDTVAFGVAVT